MPSDKTPVGKSIEFFSANDLDDPGKKKTLKAVDLELSFRSEEDREIILDGNALFSRHMKSFASDFDDSGLHIGVVEFEPGLIAPLHSHSDNCVYYVERGSIIMGNRILGPGQGFLTRANQPYGFVVGPEGLRLVEFTTGPRKTIAFEERNAAGWKKRLERAVEKLES